MKVTLRKRTTKDGRKIALYLDIYPPPEGHGRTEHLKLYLHVNPRTGAERAHNRDTLQLAEDIKVLRHKEVTEGTYKLKHPGADITLEDHIKAEADKRRDHTRHSWYLMLRHVRMTGITEKSLDKLTAPLVVRVREHFVGLVRSGELAEATAKTYFQHFRTAIRAAYKVGYILEDFSTRTSTIPAKSGQRRSLTIDELGAMARTPIRKMTIWQLGMFSALTGLRISDMRAMKWENVFDTPAGPELRFESIKTRKWEVMPIADQARMILGSRIDDDGKEKSGNIWQYVPVSTSITKWIKVWAQDAGVKPDGLSIHCMRHTYATLQLAAGTDIYTVSKMLGHSSVATTAIYAKLLDRAKREAANRLVLPGDLSKPPTFLRLVK